jgi:hypothetical protein
VTSSELLAVAFIGYWWECQKERDYYEDNDIGGWTILRWIFRDKMGVVWTGLVWLRTGTSGELV